MRCDDLTSSLEAFLERLSNAIGTGRTTDIEQLRSYLESSPPLILLLDGVDSILDPPASEAEDIFATIEEFGSYQDVCLLTTSRMYPEIRGFHRLEVPTFSGEDGRGAFYSLCHLGRSSAVDDLIARLDFHPLSIDLFATAVRENGWDESTLLKVWDDDQTDALMTLYQRRLKEAVELSFCLPGIQHLGTAARDALGAIAAYPYGVEEHNLTSAFPSITAVGATVDVLCKFSLLYRQDGFVKMLSPFRFYFLDSALEPAQHEEVIQWDAANCSAAKSCMSFSQRLYSGRRVTVFEVSPVYTSGPPKDTRGPSTHTHGPPISGSSRVTPRPRIRVTPGADWTEMFQALKRSERNNPPPLSPTPLIVL